MDLDLYLKRIGVRKAQLPADIATLRYLQRRHLLHIPFENIDIHNRVSISLAPDDLFRKIILNRRGGYCYECNGLFAGLLTALGFEVRMISCRVVQRRQLGPEFDHLALIVTIDGQDWLADAGFGDFSHTPLPLPDGRAQEAPHAGYRIAAYGMLDGTNYLSAERWHEGRNRFEPVYLFTTRAHVMEDFLGMHHFHQTSPDSHFTRSLICSMPTDEGRNSLINNRLILSGAGGSREEHLLENANQQTEALSRYFGVEAGIHVTAL